MLNIKLENLGTVNKNKVTIGKESVGTLDIYFSYETPISFELTAMPMVFSNWTRQNDWSTTTGKFLNELCPDKKARIDGKKFEKELEEALTRF